MNTTFSTRRGAVLASLGENKNEIKALNAEIDTEIAYNKYRISQLKLENKSLKRTKIRGIWLIALLIGFLKKK